MMSLLGWCIALVLSLLIIMIVGISLQDYLAALSYIYYVTGALAAPVTFHLFRTEMAESL